eukprot:GHVR01071766.1.p1 GENE.GHVR01071766.1~~GHVR01071766.1.p1  ORF type:complete len:119 (+),score=13.15 GHVR01071766.1:49-405(+)
MLTGNPNQTLYVKNINDKLSIDDIKANLYELFTAYGDILDIVTVKSNKMRGQAFIVFRELTASSTALRSLQGFNFCGKELSICFSNSESDAVAKLNGTFKPRKRQKHDNAQNVKMDNK